MEVRPSPPGLAPVPMLAVAAFVALIHAAWLLAGDPIFGHGHLADGDSYAHLVRIHQLVDTGVWYDSTFPRANAPYGDTLHWTRLFDILLLGLAWPLTPFLGFPEALFWGGAMAGPALHLMTALALAWAAMPLLGRTGAYLAGALTAAQFTIMVYAAPGRADHHLLFVLIAVLALGFLVRSLGAESYRRGPALAAGGILALGLWAGVEFYLFMGLCLLASGLAWLCSEENGARWNLHLALGLTAGLALVLLVERGPYQYLEVEYDRVSVIHLSLAALLVAFWYGADAGMGRAGTPARLLAALAGAAVGAAVLVPLYPDILLGPMAAIDPAARPYFQLVDEYKPMGGVFHSLVFLGSAVFAVPWVLWRTGRHWPTRSRWAWLLIAAALIVYVGLAGRWVRWGPYAGVFLALLLADMAVVADAAVSARLAGARRLLAKVSAIVVLIMGPAALGVAGVGAGLDDAKEGAGARPRCDMRAMADVLNRPPWAGRSLNIVASANFGPEILYRTHHDVVATLLHRNAAGMLDSLKILGGRNEGEIRALSAARRIGLILLCPGSGNDGYFVAEEGKEDLAVMYNRLARGDPPQWIGEVELPENLSGGFRLFRILGPEDG